MTRTIERGFALASALAAVLLVTSGVRAEVGGLRLVQTEQLSARLSELTFETPAVVGATKVRVLVPADYDASGATRYPVLWLLHGGGGSYVDWSDPAQGDAETLTAGYPFIVVMPDTSGHGNYVDWYNGGEGGPPMWETYHITQLLPWVDAHLPTVGTRAGRAIAGLSMGGGGAMHYAARHPDLFGAAAAFSGAVDTNSLYVQPLVETSGVGDGENLGDVFGHRATDEVRWRGHNAWDLAENLRGMFLQLDTGNGQPGGPGGGGDPIEAGVYEEMVSLHLRLDALGLPHIWNDYGAGGHTWWYWRRALSELLPRLVDVFAHPASDPARVTYRSIERDYAVFDWRVSIDRPAVEFSELRDADETGFVVRGSGVATVTTPSTFEVGATIPVTVRSRDGVTTTDVVVGPDGRLTLTVPLGPGNPHQQHTAESRAWLAQRAADDTGHLAERSQEWPVYAATVTFG